MIVKRLGPVAYDLTLEAMRAFTAARDAGHAGRDLALRAPAGLHPGHGRQAPSTCSTPAAIPVVQTDRGGQVTYHGPGQVVAYPLVDLRRLGIYVKEYVYRLEQARPADAGDLRRHRPPRARRAGHLRAPGRPVRPRARSQPAERGAEPFAGLGKIAALGIKVSRHCTYHGVALNVAMDLRPFARINPCGYAGLQTVDLATIGVRADAGTSVATHPRRQARRPTCSPPMTPAPGYDATHQAEGRGQDRAHPDQDRAGARR